MPRALLPPGCCSRAVLSTSLSSSANACARSRRTALRPGSFVLSGKSDGHEDEWAAPFGALAGQMPSIEIEDVKAARREALQSALLTPR